MNWNVNYGGQAPQAPQAIMQQSYGRVSPRDQLAMILARSGSQAQPTNIAGALDKVAQMGLSGYLMGDAQQKQDERQKAYQDTMTQAAGAMTARPAMTDAPGPVPSPGDSGYAPNPAFDNAPKAGGFSIDAKNPDMAKLVSILAGNPDTAGMGMQMSLSDMADKARAARENATRAEDRTWKEKDQETNFINQMTLADMQAEKQREMTRLQASLREPKMSFQTVSPQEITAMGLPQGTVAQRNNLGQISVINKPAINGQVLGYDAEGNPITAPGVKPMTEGQANAALYADRMRAAEPNIEKFSDAGGNVKDRVLSGIPLVGNALVSKEYQNLDQAQRDFINAVLRRESGAAISASEFENAKRQYFPYPGDGPDVLAQKDANRKTALDGISRAAGPAYTGTLRNTKPGASVNSSAPSSAGGLSPDEEAELAALRARLGR